MLGTQNSMTPSMATPSPSATPVASDPPNGASKSLHRVIVDVN